MPHTTIKILAKELQLSIATISKALRDSHEISEATKKKVLEAAQRLDYVPNPYASSLRKRSSKTIAVVLPEVSDSFFSLAINGIEQVALAKGYHVLIYLTHESYERESAILEDFRSGRVDGVLASISEETDNNIHFQKILDANLPLVFFDRACEDVATTLVVTDDFDSGYKATTHLIERGCKKIAYLAASNKLSIANDRLKGYEKAITDHGLTVNPLYNLCMGKAEEENKQLLNELLQQEDRPDGIIASVEKITPLIYLACRQLKLHLPEDIKLVSFTNLSTAPILQPSLTTITQPAYEMGQTAATILFKMLNKKIPVKRETIVLPSALTVRESS